MQVEETSESKFCEVATKYIQKLTGGPVEKEKTADDYFCDMIAKSLNVMIGGEQKKLLKLEIHQLDSRESTMWSICISEPWESFTAHIYIRKV